MIRILIAEDEEIIRSGLLYTIDWLSMNAVVVASAATGTEGLEKIKSLRPDIVITDIKMPGMSGLDMIAGAQKEKTDFIPIVLTSYSDFNYAKNAIALRVFDYLLKPVSTDTLKAKLFELFPELNDKKSDKAEPAGSFKFKAAFYIERHYAENFSLEQVAEVFRLNPFYFSRIFKEEFGQTFVEYVTAYRLQKADSLLSNSNLSIKEIAHACGYADANYFAKVYKRAYLKSPSEKRKAKKITP